VGVTGESDTRVNEVHQGVAGRPHAIALIEGLFFAVSSTTQMPSVLLADWTKFDGWILAAVVIWLRLRPALN
jgi:hypothetical protein